MGDIGMAAEGLSNTFERARWARVFTGQNAVLALPSAFLALLTVGPFLFLLWNSFKPALAGQLADFSLNNFTLANFFASYSDPKALGYLGNTFLFAAGAMVVSLLFGGGIAFLVERTNAPFRNVVYGLMFVPLIMPGVLKAIAWVMLISPTAGILNGLWHSLGFNQALFNAYSMPAMWWVDGLSMSPLMFFLLGPALRSMDPSLEEVGYTSGAGKTTTFFRITLRLVSPALAGILLIVFVHEIEALDVPLILGASAGIWVYATRIYFAVAGFSESRYGEAFVLSLVLIVLSVVALVLYQRVLHRAERYATISGKGYRPRLLNLGRWRPFAAGFIIFFVFIGAILPFLVLLWASFVPYFRLPTREALSQLTLSNYRDLFARPDFYLILKNSFILSGLVSIGSVFLATLVSWIVLRLKPMGSRLLDGLVFLPLALPAVALAFSFMIFFLYLRIGVYGTIWIMVLAYLIRFMPISSRFTNSALSQIHKELEEAGAVSGAGLVVVMRRIVVPLILPSLMGAALYIFVTANKVFTLAAILHTSDTMVLPVYVFELWSNGRTAEVSALAVLTVLALVGLAIVCRKLAQRKALEQTSIV